MGEPRHISVDGFVERLYARRRHHYVETLMVLSGIALVGFAVVHVAVASFFFRLSTNEYLELLVWVFASLTTASLVGGLVILRLMAPARRWLSGDRSPGTATAAWDAVVAGLPRVVAMATAVVCAAGVPAVLRTASVADLSASGTVTMAVLVWVLTVGGAVLMYLMLEQSVRPVVREIVAGLSPGFQPPRRTLLLSTKLLLLLIAINVYTAMLMAGLSNTSLTPEARIGLAVLISLTLPLALVLMLRRSFVVRLRDLQTAFRRVREGDLDAHLPNLAGDEVDEVGASFNEMVDGLRERVGLQDELRASRARIVAAGDASRRAVERDLHDGAQQHLVLLKLKLGLLERQVADHPAAAMVSDIRGQLDRALSDLRDLAHGIYPPALTNDGLKHALEEAAARATVRTTVACANTRRYPAELEAAVYFCCVEALQNAGKHGGDGVCATVTVEDAGAQLRFEVADDGAGFEPGTADGSSGLQNMADRIGALGGSLQIDSRPGGGTRVSGRVPVTA